MNPAGTSREQLAALEAELEDRLGRRGSDHPVRNALSIVRGLLELEELPLNAVDAAEIERRLVAIAESMSEEKFTRDFLVRLRTAAGFAKLESTPAPVVPKPRKQVVMFRGRLVSRQWVARYASTAA